MIFGEFRYVNDPRLRVPGFQVLMTVGAQAGVRSHQSIWPLVIAVAGRTSRIAEYARVHCLCFLGLKCEMPADFFVAVFTCAVGYVHKWLLVT